MVHLIFYAECQDGFYNSGCSSTCGHCLNGEYCNKITGHCPRGCESNFLQAFCLGTMYSRELTTIQYVTLWSYHWIQIVFFFIIVCEDGFYGSSCNNTCGHCLNGDYCDKRNGMCLKGCHSNFFNPFCIGNFI